MNSSPILLSLSLALLSSLGCANSHDGADGGEDAQPDYCGAILPAGECRSGACCDQVHDFRIEGCALFCEEGSLDCTPEPSCDATTCSENDECILYEPSCCASCGSFDISNYVAGTAADRDAFFRENCVDTIACPACAGEPPPPSVGATCGEAGCEIYDTRTLPLTECTSDDECTLRTASCCQCDGEGLIAIRADAESDYQALVCPELAFCPECLPSFPPEYSAYCDGGRCTVSLGEPS